MDFKDKLVFVRAKLNLTQTELAKKLNVSFSSVSRWENGKSKPTKKAIVVFNEYCKSNNIEVRED